MAAVADEPYVLPDIPPGEEVYGEAATALPETPDKSPPVSDSDVAEGSLALVPVEPAALQLPGAKIPSTITVSDDDAEKGDDEEVAESEERTSDKEGGVGEVTREGGFEGEQEEGGSGFEGAEDRNEEEDEDKEEAPLPSTKSKGKEKVIEVEEGEEEEEEEEEEEREAEEGPEGEGILGLKPYGPGSAFSRESTRKGHCEEILRGLAHKEDASFLEQLPYDELDNLAFLNLTRHIRVFLDTVDSRRDLVKTCRDLRASRGPLRRELRSAEEKITELTARIIELEQSSTLPLELQAAEEKINELSARIVELEQGSPELQKLKGAVRQLTLDRNDAYDTLARTTVDLDDAKASISKLTQDLVAEAARRSDYETRTSKHEEELQALRRQYERQIFEARSASLSETSARVAATRRESVEEYRRSTEYREALADQFQLGYDTGIKRLMDLNALSSDFRVASLGPARSPPPTPSGSGAAGSQAPPHP